ncbi:FimD/PapC C-terminal domain-containing protein [Rahnella inusitata]|uniref:FimD/PapC C-terminal domain-containing protein n=1 Tax=Rahnella inusitata TaxID=58169 RepID=UPI0039BE6F97
MIPTHGALALAEFQTSVGYRVLFAITRNGKPLPFGSTLANDANSIANSDGEIYVSGVKDRQILTVNIGEKSECNVTFDKTQATEHSGLYVLNAQCL